MGIIRIRKGSGFYISMELDGKDVFLLVPLPEQFRLLESALNKLESDLGAIYALTPSKHPLLGFSWMFTFHNQRDDGIKDTVLEYFVVEILDHLSKTTAASSVQCSYAFSPSFFRALDARVKLPVQRKISAESRLKQVVRHHLGAFKLIRPYLADAIRFGSRQGRTNLEGKTLVYRSFWKGLGRFRGYLNGLDQENLFQLDAGLLKIKNLGNGKQQNITGVFRVGDCPSVVKNIVGFGQIRRLLRQLPRENMVAHTIRHQSTTQLFFLFWKWKAMNRLFSELKPEKIILGTTFGDPQNRMTAEAAHRAGIRVCIFSTRPMLSYLRAEDRIMPEDLLPNNGAFLCDELIVLDALSQKHVLTQGMERDRVKVYQQESVEVQKIKVFSNGILLLFADPGYNEWAIRIVNKLVIERAIRPQSIYYREHPNVRLKDSQLKHLQNMGIPLVDLNTFKWTELAFERVITFSANSTSSIEAEAQGCACLWAPFYSPNALQFKGMMDSVGEICRDEEELLSNLGAYLMAKTR